MSPPDSPTGESKAAGPAGPTELPPRSWREVLKRTVRAFRAGDLNDRAAALTYYGVLSLFPGLIVLVALLGLLGQFPDTFNALLDVVRQLGPSSAVDTFAGPIGAVIAQKGTAGAALAIGLAVAVWSASGYIGAFIRVSNQIYEVEEGRPFWKLRPLQIALTIVMAAILALTGMALAVSGPLAQTIGAVIGLGDEALTAFSIAKWPLAVLVVMTMTALLYYVAPNVRQPRFRWITPGSVVAIVGWIVASVGFAVYVSGFSSYDKTYGTLGGVIVFLIWLWISNNALLFGTALNAEVERERELEAGLPAEQELQLPPREAAESS